MIVLHPSGCAPFCFSPSGSVVLRGGSDISIHRENVIFQNDYSRTIGNLCRRWKRDSSRYCVTHNPAFIPVTVPVVEGFQLVEMYYTPLYPGVASIGPTVLHPVNYVIQPLDNFPRARPWSIQFPTPAPSCLLVKPQSTVSHLVSFSSCPVSLEEWKACVSLDLSWEA